MKQQPGIDVEEYAQGLSDSFLHCRELGHVWRPRSVIRIPDGGFTRTLVCAQCTTTRIQDLNAWGVAVRNRYRHAEGYLMRGLGRMDSTSLGVLRREAITRYLDNK